jgi:hypothetical protein
MQQQEEAAAIKMEQLLVLLLLMELLVALPLTNSMDRPESQLLLSVLLMQTPVLEVELKGRGGRGAGEGDSCQRLGSKLPKGKVRGWACLQEHQQLLVAAGVLLRWPRAQGGVQQLLREQPQVGRAVDVRGGGAGGTGAGARGGSPGLAALRRQLLQRRQ